MKNFIQHHFQLDERGTSIRTELFAGMTTFVTMAYILIVNPLILSETGMEYGAVFTATAAAAMLTTLLMGLWVNLPIALASGMGLNAFFAYYVVQKMGYSWQFALTAIFLEGILFLLFSFGNIRENLINMMPATMKNAISAGIGLFIASIGLKNCGIIQGDGSTLIALADLTDPKPLVGCIGILVIGTLIAKKVPGGILIGIFATTIIGYFFGITELPAAIAGMPPSVAPVFCKFEFTSVLSMDMLIVVFTFLMIDIFDTTGLLIAFATRSNMLDENGRFPYAKKALTCDAVGTTLGACLGTSTVTAYAESTAGIAAGGRTGLASVATAGLFALSLFFSPVIAVIPGTATGAALVIIGLFMMEPILKIDFTDYYEAVPAFLTVLMMPFTSSIGDGIGIGMIAYFFLHLFGSAQRRKELNPMIAIVACLFFINYALL